MIKLKTYTVIVCDCSGHGTHWVSTITAYNTDVETLRRVARNACAQDWGTEPDCIDDLHVLAIFEGDCKCVDYDDTVFSQ